MRETRREHEDWIRRPADDLQCFVWMGDGIRESTMRECRSWRQDRTQKLRVSTPHAVVTQLCLKSADQHIQVRSKTTEVFVKVQDRLPVLE